MILVHSYDTGNAIFFNSQHIIGCMKSADGKSTTIVLTDDHMETIKESPQHVADLCHQYYIGIAVEINHRIN